MNSNYFSFETMERQIIKCGFKTIFSDKLPPSSLKKGKNLFESEHVFNVVENKDSVDDVITGCVVRQTSINQPPYQVEIKLNGDRTIRHASCQCPAGSGKHCKHISAVFTYVNNEPIQSKTDKPCEWTKPSTYSKHQYAKGKRFAELFPQKKTIRVDSEVSDVFSILKSGIHCEMKNILEQEIKTESQRFILLYIEELLNNTLVRIAEKNIENVLGHFMNNRDVFENSNVDSKYNLTTEQKAFYDNHVNLTVLELRKTFHNTTIQSASKAWNDARHIRISASSKAHQIKTLTRKEPAKLAEEFLNPHKLIGKAAANVTYGIENESKARRLYEEIYNVDVLECGLIICPEHPWLCASPDGLIFEKCLNNNYKLNYVLEIKCPSSAKKKIFDPILKTTNLQYLCWNETSKQFELKKSHQYYTQCQVLLFVTKLNRLHFFMYAENPLLIVVEKDETFLKNLLPKLEKFYFTEYLPLLVNKIGTKL